MKYQLYTTSKKAWDAMIETIDGAQKSIFLEMYIFLDDTAKSHDFIGKLKNKAREGLRIIVVADAFGSKELGPHMVSEIRKAGIEFIFFSHWLRHIHRKVLIVDEKIAFIGGVNIGERFKQWNDLQIKMHAMLAKNLLHSFAYTYEMAGGKDEKILKMRDKKFVRKLKFSLIENWPIRNIYSMKKHYVEKITQARHSIRMVTPYFTPPRWLISLLDDAIRRRVNVEIILPEKVDWKISTSINYHYMCKLHELGIRFYLMKKMNHAKLLIIDNEEGLIGSQNVDFLSFQLNNEVGIFSKDKKLVAEISKVFGRWKKRSRVFQPNNYRMRPLDYLTFMLAKILRPIL